MQRLVLMAFVAVSLVVLPACGQQKAEPKEQKTPASTSTETHMTAPTPTPTPTGPDIVGIWKVVRPGNLGGPGIALGPGTRLEIYPKFIVFPGGQAAAWYPASSKVIIVDPRFAGGMFALYVKRDGKRLMLQGPSGEVHLQWEGPVR